MLLRLSPADWRDLPLGDKLREELLVAQKIKAKSRGALKRHRGFVAGLLRAEDTEAIEAALGMSAGEVSAKDVHFHELERWRSELIASPDVTIAAFLKTHPTADRQRLRHLTRQAKKLDLEGNKSTKALQKLFAYLRLVSGS